MNPITALCLASAAIALAALGLAVWHTWKLEHRRAQMDLCNPDRGGRP